MPEQRVPDQSGKDYGSDRLDRGGATDQPAAGSGPPGPADPVERRGAGRHAGEPVGAEELEGLSAHYGAGSPRQEAAAAPPTSSARYPASSDATGATKPGSRVTGQDQGPQEDLDG